MENATQFAEQKVETREEPAHQPLLRPVQVEEAKSAIAAVDSELNAPDYIKDAQDMKSKGKLRHRLQKTLDDFAPRPFEGEKLDQA
ncbi:hypothetical protein KAR91_51950, partial [Candidatus Pacearchaeota archaeon]|nr:hypothetical protein [Candidatus Pacearchaeota archaeon]